MGLHPLAHQFTALEKICDGVAADTIVHLGTPGTSDEAAELHYHEAWYQRDRDELISKLRAIGVDPLCVLRKQHWNSIVDLYGLFELWPINGKMAVEIPADWLVTRTAVSRAHTYEGQKEHYADVSEDGVAEARRLEHTDLLLKLMPKRRSLQPAFDITTAHLLLEFVLPPIPLREGDILERLHQTSTPFSIAAVPGSIQFSPPIGTQLQGYRDDVEEQFIEWEENEPIIVVHDGSAAALVGQWGDNIIEAMAVRQALETA